jgi:membrane associated rhomboid family serine protease
VGFYDRHYNSRNFYDDGGGSGGRVGGFPPVTSMVKFILVICLAVWFLQLIFYASEVNLSSWFGVTAGSWWQIWRYITFQFLHSPDGILHIVLNMLVLYFFGCSLERSWGPRRFLTFYLICGVFAGIAYAVMIFILGRSLMDVPLVGASGGVYAVLFACAVLFPSMHVYLFFVIRIPIRVVAVVCFMSMFATAMTTLGNKSAESNSDFWSAIAHLGGVIPSLIWVLFLPKLQAVTGDVKQKIEDSAWEKKIKRREKDEEEIDQILEKIKVEGIGSLTPKEKKKLQRATERQREEDKKYSGGI